MFNMENNPNKYGEDPVNKLLFPLIHSTGEQKERKTKSSVKSFVSSAYAEGKGCGWVNTARGRLIVDDVILAKSKMEAVQPIAM